MVTLADRTLALLATHLPDATRQKAATLVAHRRVTDVVSTSSAIFATVQGAQPYGVEIIEVDNDDEGIDVFCSCTAYYKYGPCKHVYAAALEAAGRADPTARGPSGTHWSTRLMRIRKLEAQVDQPPQPRRRRAPVAYRVHVTNWDEQPIAVSCVELSDLQRATREKARWTHAPAPRTLSPTKLLRAGATNRVQLRILRELSVLEDHDRGYGPNKIAVPLNRVRPLLRLLARAASVVVVAEERVVRLEDDSRVPYRVEFVRHDDESVVHVDAELARGDERISPRDTTLLLADGTLLHGGRLARIEWRDPEEAAWLQELLSEGAMTVPVTELEYFEGDVLLDGYFPQTLLPDIEVERDVAPQPLLVVHAREGRAHPRGDVYFEYGPWRVARRDTARVVAKQGETRLIWRHVDEERRRFDELFQLPHVSRSKNDPEHDVRISPKRLPDAVLALLESGWAVEVEGRRAHTVSTSSVRVSSGQDWFDVQGVVEFDGVEVPLPDVLAATQRKDRFVRLENGGIGVVPTTFDDDWGLLAHLGRKRRTGLRFARSQGWLIDVLLSARGEVRGDEAFEALRGRIAEFAGITDHEEPPGFRGTLRPYQRHALGWFAFLRRFGLGGCLADDMGLGKTVQVLALLVERKNAGIEAPSLVVAPRSVVHNWVREAARFAPDLRVVEYAGESRADLLAEPRDVDLIATSYGILRRDAEPLAEVAFDYVVLDEAQMVKNPSSHGSRAARSLTAAHRLALTGTPVENRLTDLWAILEFACPGLLGSSRAFRGLVKASTVKAEQRAELAAAIRPVLLRRTKELVAPELPARTEHDLFCDLPPEQRALYDQLKAHYRSTLLANRARRDGRADETIGGKERMQILEALLRLRQAACHGIQPGGGADGALSGKLDELVPMLQEATDEGHKALVFSQFTKFLACVRERLDAAGIPYLYLDGKTRKREALTRRFQEDDDAHVFLISLKAGGTGLNLTAADYVFLLDPWWNPAVERQAIDRAHRIGQTRPVVAYRLIAADTVEERILDLQAAKRELAAAIVDGNASLAADLTRADLDRLLR